MVMFKALEAGFWALLQAFCSAPAVKSSFKTRLIGFQEIIS